MNKKKLVWGIAFSMLLVLIIYYLWPEAQLSDGQKSDMIKVYKSERKLILFSRGKPIAYYHVSLGGVPPFFNHPEGPKRFKDDYKTPEGKYTIKYKGHHSKYHRYLYIDYPSDMDNRFAESQNKFAGKDILIHGLSNKNRMLGKFMRFIDWTRGCIAVTNTEIEEIYGAVKIGTIIEIYP